MANILVRNGNWLSNQFCLKMAIIDQQSGHHFLKIEAFSTCPICISDTITSKWSSKYLRNLLNKQDCLVVFVRDSE